MKNITMFLIIAMLCLTKSLFSGSSRPFELGVVLGEPSGVSARLWTGKNSIDLALGMGYNSFSLHGSFLFHKISNFDIEGYKLPFYYGPRVQIGDSRDNSRFSDDKTRTKFGVYFNMGTSYMFKSIPFNLFIEVAPGIQLGDVSGFDICGGIGFRYVFGRKFKSEKKKGKPKGVEVSW